MVLKSSPLYTHRGSAALIFAVDHPTFICWPEEFPLALSRLSGINILRHIATQMIFKLLILRETSEGEVLSHVLFGIMQLVSAIRSRDHPIGRDRNQHVHDDSERRNAAQQTDNKSDTAEELGANREKRQRRGNTHLLGEEAHRALESVAAKPAQHLLRSVHEEGHTENQAHKGERQNVESRRVCETLAFSY